VDLVRDDVTIAHLQLRDGAEVDLRPGSVPVLALRGGLVRVDALRDLKVKAAHLELMVDSGAEVEIGRGDSSMIKSWLVPGGVGAAAGAALVAVLVHHGGVEMKTPESRPVEVAPSKALVLEVPTTRPAVDDDRERKLAQAERKIADLEKKLAASKKEGEKLASDLVQKKGVTLDNIAARLADLRKKGQMEIMLPGKTADLIADLKGLGAAGTQALVDMLKSTDPKDRFMAAKLLEELKDPASIAALREAALNDSDALAAKMAGHAIALMEDPSATEALREIYAKHGSWEAEVNSLWGLAKLGDPQGIEQSIAYMNDSKISAGARAALGANIAALIQTPEMMPIVDQTVHDFYTSDQVMGIAIDFYKAIGSAVARDRLQAIVNDTRVSQAMRDRASQALND
jgi:hypothetical protein